MVHAAGTLSTGGACERRGGRRVSAPSSVAMQDLTTGPITRHLLKTTGFMLVTMLFQTLYFLIDLYWVGRLGTAAVTAGGIAGNLTFIVPALTHMLGVGTTDVILNMLLAPFLIFGWGTGRPLGVAGAAIASLVAIVAGLVWLTAYFRKVGSFLRFDPRAWRPRPDVWKRMLGIGLPSGAEFGITTVYLALVYSITRPFGAAAQAGFGIGMRIIQAGFMPVVALAFSVPPVAGQNFGARLAQRVKDTFKDAAWMAVALMVAFALACHFLPGPLVRVFSKDEGVIAVGTEYLRIIPFNYIASGFLVARDVP